MKQAPLLGSEVSNKALFPDVVGSGQRQTQRFPAVKSRRGFTLIEMLVTMVILSMISSLLWQALQQMAGVERFLQSTGVQSQLLFVRRQWLRNLIESALPEQQNAEVQFRGDARKLRLASAENLNLPGIGSGVLELSLHHDSAERLNRVTLDQVRPTGFDAPVGGITASPTTLLSWKGEPGRLSYLDSVGQWHDEWPLSNSEVKLLPSAVRIELGGDAGGPLLAAVAANAMPRPRRTDWEKQ